MQSLESGPVQHLVTRQERLTLEIEALDKELGQLYEEFHNLEAKIETTEDKIEGKEKERAYIASQFSEEDARLGRRTIETQEAITSSDDVIDLTQRGKWHAPSERAASEVQNEIDALLEKQKAFRQRRDAVDILIDEKREALEALKHARYDQRSERDGVVVPLSPRKD